MLQSDGTLCLAGAGMGNVNFTFNTSVTAGTWHRLAVTWDDNAGTGSIALDCDVKTYFLLQVH